MRSVVEPIAAHWQDERLWLELVSDPNTRHWSVCVRDEFGHRVQRHLGLDRALGILACGARGRARPLGWRDA
jgi:hypothetical protein